MADKNLVIKIKQEIEGRGLSELRTMLKSVQAEMNNLVQSGQRGSDEFNNLKTRAGILNGEIRGLGREFRGLDKDVKMSRLQLLEMGENITVVAYGVKTAFTNMKSKVSDFISEANKLQAANLGLESIAKFKGVDSDAVVKSIQSLDLVKNGLLTIGDASLAVKNLLSTGFSLPQAIQLIKRFGDTAAFGRQSSLEFGYAITSATEGIKNQNSMLVDNAGVTKNISVIMKEAGFEMKDLTDKTKGHSALLALYNGLLKETEGQLGDAEKLTKTFAGQQAKLEAQVRTLKQEFGVFLQNALLPFLDTITNSSDATKKFAGGIVLIGGSLADLLPIIASLKIAFPALWASAGAGIAGLVTSIGTVAVAGGLAMAYLEDLINNWAPFSFQISNPEAAYDNYIKKQTENLINNPPPSGNRAMLDKTMNEEQQKKADEDYIAELNRKNDEKVAKYNQKLNVDKKKTSTNGGSNTNKDSEEAVKLTTDLSRLQDEIINTKAEFEVLKTELTSQGIVWDNNTVAVRKYLDAISELEISEKSLKINLKDIKSPDVVDFNLPKYDNKPNKVIEPIKLSFAEQTNLTGRDREKEQAEKDKQNEIANSFVNSISNSLNGIVTTFGLHAETTVAKIAQGFQTVIGIVQTIQSILSAIQTAQSFISIIGKLIPGRAMGGDVSAGQPYIVGDAPNGSLTPYSELFVPNSSGHIFNNSQFMNMLKGNSIKNVVAEPKTMVVNKYYAMEHDGIKFLETNMPPYLNKKNFRQL